MTDKLPPLRDSYTQEVPRDMFFDGGLPVVLIIAVDAITDRGIDLALTGGHVPIQAVKDTVGYENCILAPSPYLLPSMYGKPVHSAFLLSQHGDGFGGRTFEIYDSTDEVAP